MRENESVVPGIVNIVASYYLDGEAGIFQLAFNIYSLTKKANHHTITIKMVHKLTTKLLERGSAKGAKVSTADIDFYCTELVRLGYLKALKQNGLESKSCRKMGIGYVIPMEKGLEFSTFRK